VNSVAVQNARIWGYASTGGALPQVGPQGSIGPFGSANGFIDMNRVSTHFFANFEAGFSQKIVQRYTSMAGQPIANLGNTGKYRLTTLNLNSTVLNVTGTVELYLDGLAGVTTLSITGTGGINVAPGAKLTLYTVGNVNIAGNGIVNSGSTGTTAGNPANFQLYGQSTATATKQQISIAGNAALSGALYAPNASVTIAGGGSADRDILGSIVANDITFSGNIQFHQDESLAKLTTAAPYRLTSWNELTTVSEREPYKDDLDDI
jgi:hypothetical protein